MSLSAPKPEAAANPAKRKLEVKSGRIEEYIPAETKGEKGTIKKHDVPFGFVVLDELVSISGYCESKNNGLYSNEVTDHSKQKLVVRCGKEVVAEGYYENIKETVKALGGKYTIVVYAAIRKASNKNELEMIRVTFAGGGVGEWFEFKRAENVFDGNLVVMSGWEDRKKGAVNFQVPAFSRHEMPEELKEKAIEMDKSLQEFLKVFISHQQDEMGNYQAADTGDSDKNYGGGSDEDYHDDGSDDIPF
jgi:hypothetical protein